MIILNLRPMQMDATSQHCCVLLWVFGQQCCVRLHVPKSSSGFKLYATSANIIVVPCNVACCWPTVLRPFAWAFNYKQPDFDFPSLVFVPGVGISS